MGRSIQLVREMGRKFGVVEGVRGQGKRGIGELWFGPDEGKGGGGGGGGMDIEGGYLM